VDQFSIIAFYRGYIGLLIKFKQSKSPALKQRAKYCKLGGKIRPIVDLGRRPVGGGIFRFAIDLSCGNFREYSYLHAAQKCC